MLLLNFFDKKWPGIFYILLLILISGAYLIYEVDNAIISNELEKRSILVQNESNIAANHLQKGIEKFSLIVFSIRSFLSENPEKNNAVDLQQFLNLQLKDQLSQDSLIVSFLDTNHVFQYSITRHSLTPNGLKGTSVKSLRDPSELNRLEDLMKKDNLVLFPPLNLIEGWSGIPLNFRVIENGILQGYVAPIMNLQSILDEVYRDAQSKNFVYRFSTQNGLSFDRKTVYDEQKRYTSSQDPESFKNVDIPAENFHYTTFTIHGYEFKVGAAYKEPYHRSFTMLLALIGWIIIFGLSIFGIFMFWKLQTRKQELLELKNQELTITAEGLEHFIRASSHDLKEPLRNISSFSTLLNRRYHDKLDETANQYLGFIASGVENMNILLNDLLIYSSLIHKPELPKQKIDLNQLIAEIIENQDPEISNHRVKVDVANLPTLYFNREQAYRLFDNLIANAIKHNDHPEPRVSIRYSRAPNHHLFQVKDNGKEIEEAYHDKIFEVFQRLSREKRGSGIGLAVCKKIIEHEGGSIWLESAEGEGNTFCFTVPL